MMNTVDSPPINHQKFPNDSVTVSHNDDQGKSQHFVQFYESESFLETRVAEFISTAFKSGESAILIATPEHRSAIEKRISHQGFSIPELAKAGNYFSFDAKETLSRFMLANVPNEKLFFRELSTVLDKATSGHRRRVCAFGEMVALLCADQNHESAISFRRCGMNLAKATRFHCSARIP